MPPADVVLRENAERHGFTLRLSVVAGEEGYLELQRGEVVLRAIIPREKQLGYDPWDALLQAMYALTEIGE